MEVIVRGVEDVRTVNIRMQARRIAKRGEKLSQNLNFQVMKLGDSRNGFLTETYALANSWALLRWYAASNGFDVDHLFRKLTTIFEQHLDTNSIDKPSKLYSQLLHLRKQTLDHLVSEINEYPINQ